MSAARALVGRHAIPVAAVALFVAILALELAAPATFVPLVAAAILAAPAINWLAWRRLKDKRQLRVALRLEPIISLARIEQIALITAIASTCTAGLGLFVVARALDPLIFAVFGVHVEAAQREVFLVFLSYPPLLLTIPALLWLRTVAELERQERESLTNQPPGS